MQSVGIHGAISEARPPEPRGGRQQAAQLITASDAAAESDGRLLTSARVLDDRGSVRRTSPSWRATTPAFYHAPTAENIALVWRVWLPAVTRSTSMLTRMRSVILAVLPMCRLESRRTRGHASGAARSALRCVSDRSQRKNRISTCLLIFLSLMERVVTTVSYVSLPL